MIVGIYCRVSTVEQAREGYSIGEQQERLQKYCDAKGWKVFKIYTDAGYSGKDLNRPAMQNLIKDVKAKKLNMVLVYKLDRLSRSQKDTLMLIEDVFLKNNVDFNSMEENFDTSTPLGRAMIGVLAVFAQLEREQIKERMRMGKDARAKEGKWIGGSNMPYGYDYVDHELVINEYEAMQIRIMYKMIIEGHSCYKIADHLNAKGFYPRSSIWSEGGVRREMASRVPNGYLKYQQEWHPASHEKIIDDVTYNKAQKAIEKRSILYRNSNRNPGKATTYLGGYLVCGCCGNKYVKNAATRKNKDGSIHTYAFYECRTSHPRNSTKKALLNGRTCDNKRWKVEELTALVFDQIKLLKTEPGYVEQVSSFVDDTDDELMMEAVSKFDDQISRLMDLYSLGKMPVDLLQRKVDDIKNKKEKLEAEIARIHDERGKHIALDEVKVRIDQFPEILDSGNFDEIRAIIADLIEKIEINGEDITIYWRF